MNADPLFVSAIPVVPYDVRLHAGLPACGAGSVTGGGPDHFANPVSAPSNSGADQSS
ncbi:hypothetical protein [Streptomyces sp. NPDC050564]|uniref:hypothetical protein n=1 Tax=Streptomyces sp. NPDC050564 TaxID=3365631 RepID=UPI0037A698FF